MRLKTRHEGHEPAHAHEPGHADGAVPVLLGDGIRLYHKPGGNPIRLHRLDNHDLTSTIRVRYRVSAMAKVETEKLDG